jgi:hypothetical protein
MYDYGHVKRYRIENVDHEIHILGVKLGYFPYLLWGFLLGLMVGGPLLALGSVILVIMLCRYCYAQEIRGEPVILNPRLLSYLQRWPRSLRERVSSLLPGLGAIEFPRKYYRE